MLLRLDQAPSEQNAAWLWFYLGSLANDQGRFVEAENWFKQAANGFSEASEPEGEVYALTNLARIFEARSQLESALEQVDQAQSVAASAGDTNLVAVTKLQRARLLMEQGEDFSAVETELEELDLLFFEEGSSTFKRDLLLARGRAAFEVGDHLVAKRCYQRGIALATSLGDSFGEMVFRNNLLDIVVARNRESDRTQVTQGFSRLVEVAERAENWTVVAKARVALARFGSPDEAQAQLAMARGAAARMEGGTLKAEVELYESLQLLGNAPETALSEVQKASRRLSEAASPWGLLYNWAPRAEVVWATMGPEDAVADVQRTIGLVENLRELQGTEAGRAQFLAPWLEIHRWLYGRLLQTGDAGSVAQAFSLSESMRARVLLETQGPRVPIREAGSTASAREDDLLDEIVDLQKSLLFTDLSESERARQVNRLELLEQERARTTEESSAHGVAQFVSLSQLQAELDQTEAVLSFVTGEWNGLDRAFAGGSWLLAVTESSARAVELPAGSQLEAAVRIANGLLADGGAQQVAAFRQLAEMLLNDVLHTFSSSVSRLLIIGDTSLSSLPFGALVTNAAPEIEMALLDSFHVSVIPSATLWYRERIRPEGSPRRRVLALVSPDITATASATSSVPFDLSSLGALPFALREGKALRRLLRDRATVLTAGEASEAALKAVDTSDIGVLHFGAHAVVDEHQYQRSAVILAAGSAQQDGLLLAEDIRQLELDGVSVILGTCQSAAGRTIDGEGVMSLARSFMASGAPAVVSTLRPVDDRSAAVFFAAFYGHLRSGLALDESVARAQRQLRSEGAPAEQWANWIVLGDGSVRPIEPSDTPALTAPRLFLIGAAVLLLIAIGVFSRARFSQ